MPPRILPAALGVLLAAATSVAQPSAPNFSGTYELDGTYSNRRATSVELSIQPIDAQGRLLVTRTARYTSRRHRHWPAFTWQAEVLSTHGGVLRLLYVVPTASGLTGSVAHLGAGPQVNVFFARYTFTPSGDLHEFVFNITRHDPEHWWKRIVTEGPRILAPAPTWLDQIKRDYEADSEHLSFDHFDRLRRQVLSAPLDAHYDALEISDTITNSAYVWRGANQAILLQTSYDEGGEVRIYSPAGALLDIGVWENGGLTWLGDPRFPWLDRLKSELEQEDLSNPQRFAVATSGLPESTGMRLGALADYPAPSVAYRWLDTNRAVVLVTDHQQGKEARVLSPDGVMLSLGLWKNGTVEWVDVARK